MVTGQMTAPIRQAGWLGLHLILLTAAVAVRLPNASGGPLAWFGIPLLGLLAVNAAWRLHNQGRAVTPPAGLGMMIGSALALLFARNSDAGGLEVVRVVSAFQLAIGALLIALQAPDLESLRTLLRNWLRRQSVHPHKAESQQRVALDPRGWPPAFARLLARNSLDVVWILVVGINTLLLATLVGYLVAFWGDPTSIAIGLSLLTVLGLIELVLLLDLWRPSPKAGAKRPPVLLLLTAGPALLILGQQPSHAPWPTAFAALATLLGAYLYLRACRRLGKPQANHHSAERSVRQRAFRVSPADASRQTISSSKPWSPAELWISYAAAPLLMYGIAFLLVPFLAFADAGDAVIELAGIEAKLLALWLMLVYLVLRKGHPWSVLGIRPFPMRSLLVIPVILVVNSFAIGAFNSALLPILPAVQSYQASVDEYVEPSAASIALLFLGVVVVAPIAEELLFRGFFFTGFRSYIGPLPAAVLSALLFSLAHTFPIFFPFSLNLHPSQALGAFLVGLVFAGMRHDSDSIFPSMIAHATWNMLVILV